MEYAREKFKFSIQNMNAIRKAINSIRFFLQSKLPRKQNQNFNSGKKFNSFFLNQNYPEHKIKISIQKLHLPRSSCAHNAPVGKQSTRLLILSPPEDGDVKKKGARGYVGIGIVLRVPNGTNNVAQGKWGSSQEKRGQQKMNFPPQSFQ